MMTEIEYEVREQDLLAFNDHQLKNSQGLQKVLRRHQGIVPGVLAVLSMFLWFYYQDTLSAIYVAVTAVAWGLLTPVFLKWQMRQRIRKMYSDADMAAVLGKYKLRSEQDALVEVSRVGESRVSWADILRIDVIKGYVFIFVTLDTALIVPYATVKTGDLREFLKDADARLEQAA
ncbi:YcxB family protein [Methylomagnum ishizawai]|uniref:YcxB family protein n=1 Tax=Methylomagnum ishizawai TaxID=1760988 RepID=UPI001C325E25|nr:YcxB family protein [Methylomagnum ishizawai]BBL74765.1 hypothetical protein MishRS11D_18630 [Methylomagnum ishizawai]